MDNYYDLEELFKIEDPEEDAINNIPENLVEEIMKKQETIHEIGPVHRHSANEVDRRSVQSVRSYGLERHSSRVSENTEFHSLDSEHAQSPSKQDMRDLYYDSLTEWQLSNDRQRSLVELNIVLQKYFPQLTQIKISLKQLQEVEFQFPSQKKSSISLSSNKNHPRVFEYQDQDESYSEKSKEEIEEKVEVVEKISEEWEKFIQNYKVELQKYIKTLKIREIQMGSLLFLFEHHDEKESSIEEYNEIYGDLGKLIIECKSVQERDKTPLNVLAIEQATETEVQLFREYKDTIESISQNILNKKYRKDINTIIKLLNKLKVLNSKIVTIAELFPFICTFDPEDLFSLPRAPEAHPRWHKLQKGVIQSKLYGDSMKIRESFQMHKSGLNLLNATMSIIHQSKDYWLRDKKNWGKLAQSTAKIVKCAINRTDAHHEAQVLFSDPNEALTKQIWNLPEQKIVKNFIGGLLPSIHFSQQLWIPRLFDEYLKLQGKIGIPNVTILNASKYLQEGEIADEENKIKMRINCPFPLIKKNEYFIEENRGFFASIKSYFKKTPKVPEKLVFHIHGGGFISMSSFIHQTYTRVWSNNLDVPIISVDYRKAPENPYPDGLKDCFQGYMWTLYCFRQIYEIEPVKIVFVGDSAGGNLAAALINLLITYKLRVPDGLVLVYPVLNLNLHQYTPSLINALNDFILPHTLLKLCEKAYLSNSSYMPSDPNVSPIFTPDKILIRYPPVRIFVGSKDPFHDDCCRFTQKLFKLHKNIKSMVFDEFPHGFLQFDLKAQPHEPCRKATKQVENALREFLNQ